MPTTLMMFSSFFFLVLLWFVDDGAPTNDEQSHKVKASKKINNRQDLENQIMIYIFPQQTLCWEAQMNFSGRFRILRGRIREPTGLSLTRDLLVDKDALDISHVITKKYSHFEAHRENLQWNWIEIDFTAVPTEDGSSLILVNQRRYVLNSRLRLW